MPLIDMFPLLLFPIPALNQGGLRESEQGKISCNPQKMLLTGFSN